MKQDRKLNFLLIYGHLRTGGIETLIVRMANWLVNNGHNVYILLKEPGELLELLDKKIELDVLGDKHKNIFFSKEGRKRFKRYDDYLIDIIYSFGPEACYFASYVYKHGFKKNKPIFLNGTYHPNEFALSGGVSRIDRMHIELYNKFVNDKSKVFMSDQVRLGNEKILGVTLPEAFIWPLPVDGSRFKNIHRKIIPYRIISIGRFAEFKTYNLYMFDVIEKLRSIGYDATWEVYGYGPLEDEMKRLQEEKGLKDCTFLKGSLPYEDYAKALSVAHVFVGVGTSLIEAGFCGVPCIPAIQDDRKSLTYGPLYKLPYYSCGEYLGKKKKTMSIIDAIRKIFEMSKEQYENESTLNLQYVQRYSIDNLMEDFINIAKNKKTNQKIDLYPEWKYKLYYLELIYAKLRKKFRLRKRIKKLICARP